MILQAALPDPTQSAELAAGALEAAITSLLTLLCLGVWRRSRVSHFGWWAVAFALYTVRIGAIMAFLATRELAWLFWHQVITGWVALALLWAAFVFARSEPRGAWRWALVAFPPLWSYVAVNRLDNFTLAAVPAVVFIAGATLWTGVVLLRDRRPSVGVARALLGWSFVVWGLHHLDYPILRARGAWLPWGYYLDILFLLAVGAGILLLVNADLTAHLQSRTADLERLSQRMVRHHEEERRRLSIALHDETAQVFAAVKMQLGVVREQVDANAAARLDHAIELFDGGIQGVRRVTHDLRPALLDDLGLLPALRSLVAEFGAQHFIQSTLIAPATLPVMGTSAELAIYRAVQESLSNVSRHARDATATVTIAMEDHRLTIAVQDTGPGLDAADALDRAEASGHLGLVGMRERITALGGELHVTSARGEGVLVHITLPVVEEEGS